MRKWPGTAFWTVAAALIVIVYVLMIKPIVGVADNGDYLRVMLSANLDYVNPDMSYDDKYFGYLIREFRFADVMFSGYLSTQLLLVFAAVILNKLLYSTVLFDIRFMAAVYSMLLLAAFYFAVRFHRGMPTAFKAALGVLLVFIFADAGYIGYFNSLYGEPVSYVFMLLIVILAIGLALRERPSLALLAAFFACAVFLTGSKVQNAPIGIMLALLGLRFIRLRADAAWRATAIGLSGLLALGSMAMYLFAPHEFKEINTYQTVFYGVLKDSPTPERDLEELGLSKELAVLAGTNFFTKNTPIPQRDPRLYELFYGKVSHADIALFYIKHPIRLAQKLETAAKHGTSIAPTYLGTYEKSEGMPAFASSGKFHAYSEWKRMYMPATLWMMAPFALIYFAIAWWERVRARELRQRVYAETFILLGLVALYAFAIPIIGDGEADLSKHLFLFNVCFDLMLASSVLWIVNKLVR